MKGKKEAEVAVAAEDVADIAVTGPDMLDAEVPDAVTTKDCRQSPATTEVTNQRKRDAVAAEDAA